LHSRVAFNVDVPTTGLDILKLVTHEVYPGHHAEHALKEHLLGLEERIALVPTPQALVAEGIAEAGGEIVLDDEALEEAFAVMRRHGLEASDPELLLRLRQVAERLGTVSQNAALMIHEDGVSQSDAAAYIAKWSLRPLNEAEQSVAFVTDPTWRAYVITYDAGLELCRRYIGGDPARLRRLLTEHVRIGELLSA
jgi:hypothetical protein